MKISFIKIAAYYFPAYPNKKNPKQILSGLPPSMLDRCFLLQSALGKSQYHSDLIESSIYQNRIEWLA